MGGTPVHEGQGAPGYRTLNPATVLRIEDADGRVLWEYSPEMTTFQRRLVLEPALAYIMSDILADAEARAPAFGRNSPLNLSRRAAVKTEKRPQGRLDDRLHAADRNGSVGGEQQQPLDDRRHG